VPPKIASASLAVYHSFRLGRFAVALNLHSMACMLKSICCLCKKRFLS
jgi:hypothetical protein